MVATLASVVTRPLLPGLAPAEAARAWWLLMVAG